MPDTGDFRTRLADALASSWAAKARPSQRMPPGDWSIWLLQAGRGFGKTRVLSETVNSWATSGEHSRIALVCATAADARDTLVEGESGILECAPDWCHPVYQASRRRVIWPNDAVAHLYSAEEPERLRGPQHSAAVCDELGAWARPETFDQLQFGLRLGNHPRTVIATTPRPTRLLRSIIAREGNDVVITRGTSYENRANLAPAFFDQIIRKYEGTRLGRQELNAELLEDTPGALWTIDMLDRCRRSEAPADLQRVVVAFDPAVSTREGSDETGIIVAGKDDRGHGYIIEDLSGRYAPADWARLAISAYREHGADRIVAEVNQGGAMVEATLRTIDPNIPYSAVHATRGKYTRAEPVAALFEQRRCHLVGHFERLEEQLCLFVQDMDRSRDGSPDRADSMIWAMTELLVEAERFSGLMQWYSTQAARSAAAPAEPPGSNVIPFPSSAILYAAPYSSFQAGSGRKYTANEDGQLEVENEDDRGDLLRAGCRASR